jgi:hypothetical protein
MLDIFNVRRLNIALTVALTRSARDDHDAPRSHRLFIFFVDILLFFKLLSREDKLPGVSLKRVSEFGGHPAAHRSTDSSNRDEMTRTAWYLCILGLLHRLTIALLSDGSLSHIPHQPYLRRVFYAFHISDCSSFLGHKFHYLEANWPTRACLLPPCF